MPALLERPKMTRAMYEALKRHIIREREKKKQEQEQDAMMERLKKERELRKKKEEEDHLTLEQTKEQIAQLGKKVEMLKAQKHELFSQLKKVLHQDDKRKAQQKEESELPLQQPTYHPPQLATAPQPMMMHGRPALYKPAPHIITGIKRQRSPTPPPSSSAGPYSSYSHSDNKYPHTSDGKYSEVKFSHTEAKFGHTDPKYLASFAGGKAGPPGHLYTAQHAQAADFKPAAYPPAGAGQLYAPSSFPQQATAGSSYGGSQPGGSKYSSSQSAFTSYQSHYAQSHSQKALADQFPAAYPIQRMQQPTARSGFHPGLQLQQPLEHPGQKAPSAFEDKYKLGQSQIRGLVPQQMSQALQLQQQQAKSSAGFVPGYPARSQAGPPGASYPTSTSATNYTSNPSSGQGRPGYGGQPHGRYYQ